MGLGVIIASLISDVGSYVINMILSGVVAVFNAIGAVMASAFTAELSLVYKFISNDSLVFGGSFQKLLEFNAVVIPGLAMLVFLVWLVAKGLTGGNSKNSTEEMLKRIIGAIVISSVLTLLVDPVEKLVGALDDALLSLANTNGPALAHTFATLFTVSALTGIEDSIFITLVILVIGLILAGILILILIVAHAAVFLLIYFAPYLTLFRKDGFREAVEGVVAALSLPFIIASILAVGIAAMGATGVITQPAAALGSGATQLSAMIGSHLVSFSTALTATSTSAKSVDPVQYFSDAFGGMLILGAAVFLPKFILGMIFQAGTAIHNAFQSGHQQLAGTAMGGSDKEGGIKGKISKQLHNKLGSGGTPPGGGGGGGGTLSSGGTDRKKLADEALSKKPAVGGNGSTYSSAASSSSIRQTPTGASAGANGGQNSSDPAATPTERIPVVNGPAQDLEGTEGAEPVPTSGVPGGTPTDEAGLANEEENSSKPRHLTPKEWVGTHYKGTIQAIPDAFDNMPRIQPEHPLQMGIEARNAWRAAKRKNIRQVRDTARALPPPAKKVKKPPNDPPPPPPPPGGGAVSVEGDSPGEPVPTSQPSPDEGSS